MNILHIDCSPRQISWSRRLSAAVVARLQSDFTATVVSRDLGFAPLPHADADYAQTLSSPASLTATQTQSATALSEELIGEIELADILVIGTPMNNFTVPSVLKAWIDQVLRMGRTIGTTPDGAKTGLLDNKPVYIAVSSGGIFSGERARQPDFLTPYLSAALECIGLKTLHFLPLQATAFLSDEELLAERDRLLAAMPAPQR